MKVVNVKRKVMAVMALLAVLCLLAAGCGSEIYEIDEERFMDDMLHKVTFDCELSRLQDDAVDAFFTIPEGTEAVVYMGNGAYADHAAIFEAEDAPAAEKILEELKGYTDDLKHSFEDYIPQEAAKIDRAVVVQKGNCVVLCITSDETAKSFVDGYFASAGVGDETEGTAEQDAEVQPEDTGEEVSAEEEKTEEPVKESKYPRIEMKGELKDYGNVIAVGDTAYELYSYSSSVGDKYAAAVNSAADSLDGQTRVISVMIPLSSGITLPNDLYGEIPSSSQKNALKKLTEKMNENVTVVNPYVNLMKHRDEYIYFRTDHHWTADGAYYAYEELCHEMGFEPISREERKSVDFEGFVGSFYKDTGENPALKEHPDTVRAYYPVSKNTSLTYTTTEGRTNDWKIIWNVNDYGSSMKYSTFIAGDNPYTVIKNEELEDGPRCVVVKESFGNALVPFLVDHYSRIYVIDYRYWKGDLTAFAADKGADDLIFMNNLSMIRSDYLVGKLISIL
ncbi:MAG: DUF4358 domain-containing protein [Firmicutes bacterium]|nr:DUF4358 domain-containing protein [Bacillota bacterium]